METAIRHSDENIRKIEDIIDIQKANGSLTTGRQVSFRAESAAAAGESRSTSSARAPGAGGRRKRRHHRRCASPPLPDAVSWPSDSDVTVLRMRGAAVSDAGGAAPGDGPHRADGSSMVNLATLVTAPARKPRELLLPLSSWERAPPPCAEPASNTPLERVARFLRLYFCPCCSCLYELEKGPRYEPHDAPRRAACNA